MINPVKADSVMEDILLNLNETRAVEFKPSFPWPQSITDLQVNDKAQEVIITILALSNLRDGGKIILGVERDSGGSYARMGMNAGHLATYDPDLIYDQVRNFGEPEPRLQIANVEYGGQFFIVFNVRSFLLSPVISRNKRPLMKLKDAALYTRSDKPESKRVSDAVETKEIVDLAVEKELVTFSARVEILLSGTLSQLRLQRQPEPAKAQADREKFNNEIEDIRTLS
jgi:predicted HTH transcriptional regulator